MPVVKSRGAGSVAGPLGHVRTGQEALPSDPVALGEEHSGSCSRCSSRDAANNREFVAPAL
jgi:hypothetical protein